MSDWLKRLASSPGPGRSKMDSDSGSRARISVDSRAQRVDRKAVLDSFKTHWLQAWIIMQRKTVGPSVQNAECLDESIVINGDDMTTIINHFDQMVTLLIEENSRVSDDDSTPIMMSPLLDYLLMESILDKIFNWSLNIGQYTSIMKLEQLKLYELLISQLCHQTALFQKPLVRPLMQLLATCGDCAPVEVEKRLVILLNTLCVCLCQNPRLLEFFFVPESLTEGCTSPVTEFTSSPLLVSKFSYLNKPESRFLMFSLLIPFVHREGAIGQQARDALLLIMALARKNDHLGAYIAENSNFCPVLATGLSGLYSSLPRKLANEALASGEWHQITEEDIKDTAELQLFLNSLEFCNAVVQVAHPLVKQQLLELVYQGFLVSVIGPALHQNSLEEIVATTAYLELFLRTVNEPSLLQVFLKFICVECFDDQRILDTLIGRLRAKTKLGLLTIVLFHTLLDLNCEDVMLELVLRHLIQLKVSSKDVSDMNDIKKFHESVQKFTSLTPKCCYSADISGTFLNLTNCTTDSVDSFIMVEAGEQSESFSSLNSPSCLSSSRSYIDYLNEAFLAVKRCRRACKLWSSKYDVVHKYESVASPVHGQRMDNSPMDSGIFLNNTYLVEATHSPPTGDVSDLTQRLKPDESELIGPFLCNIFDRLAEMPHNDVYTNLQLTGLISRLVTYPQPILRIFLFTDHSSHGSSRTLWSVLVTVKEKIESLSAEIEHFPELLLKAQNFFKSRDERFFIDCSTPFGAGGSSRKNSFSSENCVSLDTPKEHKRRSFSSFFFGSRTKTPSASQPKLKPVNGLGYRFINRHRSRVDEGIDACDYHKLMENENTVLAAVVLEEFLKELAAISQEHCLQDFDFCP